ncbi:LysM domain protein [Caballeronia pedi]|uniref:LysM domain protein n=1 Tax=Caballeronia pedi TaxID=1777141 RepID=A0A158E6U8_9BURK|nr:LysM domain-containing protein [Caballeronia pedi]SAL02579.1 LysM domain protein [Caballeronia pedi]
MFAQSRVEYDALNRVISISDNSYQVSYEYDAVGNRRHTTATYTDMVGNHEKKTQDYWYEYDALNRFTVTMGTLSGERASDENDASVHIVVGRAGGEGVQLGYNAAGERVMAVYAKDGRTERYEYDANGYLSTQRINGVVAQQRSNDLLGRVTYQVERDVSTGQIVRNADRTWDADSFLMVEYEHTQHNTTSYTRLADGTVAAIETKPTDPSGTRTVTTYNYEWWDGAKQSKVTVQPTNPNSPGWKAATTYYNYDINGNLKSTFDDGGNEPGNARAFQYWTDLRGQVQRRSELTGVTVSASGAISGTEGVRKHNYYYLNGNRVGNQGNDGVDEIDYVQELAGKLGKGSDSQYKVFTPVGTADFDENYMAINATYPGVSPGTWTVRAGETLQSIASALWGDATLWYILADANGLQGTDVLKAGQTLTVPNKVTNVHNTATTFKPYDPGKAIGDTQPTLPDPPPPPGKGGGCGMALMIVAIVVTVIVTAVTYGATSEFLYAELGVTAETASTAVNVGVGVAAGATAGTAGAAASQAVMIAGGLQAGFNWNGIAMGALGGALTGGMNAGLGTALPNALERVGSAVALGALRSSVIQGLGMITGAQHSFDWKSMAASAIASGVGSAVGQTPLGKMQYVGAGAQGLAAGATSTLVRGGSLQRDAAGIAGDTIGAMVSAQMAQRSVAPAQSYTQRVTSGGSYTDDVYARLVDAFGSVDGASSYGGSTGGMMFAGPGAPEAKYVGQFPAIHTTQNGSWLEDAAAATSMAFGPGYDGALSGLTTASTGYGGDVDLNAAAFRASMKDGGMSSLVADSGDILEKLGNDAQAWMDARQAQLPRLAPDTGPQLVPLNGTGSLANSDAAFLRFMETQGTQPLGGLIANAALQTTGNTSYAAAVADAAWPLDALLIPGGVRATSVASTRRGSGMVGRSYTGDPLASDFVGPSRPISAAQMELLTVNADAHALARHGGSVTDAQLLTRALTGIASDGSIKLARNGVPILPPMSSAFHSDQLLAYADQYVRGSGALASAIANNPGAPYVTVMPASVGDMGLDLGRGYVRVGASKFSPDLHGAPQLVDNLRSVQGTYALNPTTGKWETVTLFPAR